MLHLASKTPPGGPAPDVAQALEEYIYRDGYGPTIQTVETYLRNEFPSLYVFPKGRLGHRVPDHPTVTQADGGS